MDSRDDINISESSIPIWSQVCDFLISPDKTRFTITNDIEPNGSTVTSVEID